MEDATAVKLIDSPRDQHSQDVSSSSHVVSLPALSASQVHHVSSAALGAASHVMSTPVKLAQRLSTTIAGALYLIPGLKSAEEDPANAEAFIRYWHNEELLGPGDFRHGRLPKASPLERYLTYLHLPAPDGLGQTAITMKINRNIAFPVPKNKFLLPLQIFSSMQAPVAVDPGSITGQAHRNFLGSKDLTNVVVYLRPNAPPLIRCGVIDTSRRADHLLATVRYAQQVSREKYGHALEVPRMVSQQLNTKGMIGFGEKGLIIGQATQAHELEKRRQGWLGHIGGPLGAHFNTGIDDANALLPNQEAFSREFNVYGASVFLDWMAQDFFGEETPSFLSREEGSLRHTLEQVMQAYAGNDPKLTERWNDQLSRQLHKILKPLKTLHTALSENKETDTKKLLALQMMIRLIAIETSQEKKIQVEEVRPVQEIALRVLLCHLFNAIIQVNCYSGADRTGFIWALTAAIGDKVESRTKHLKDPVEAISVVFNFMMSFEKRVAAMDLLLRDKDPDFDLDAWLKTVEGKGYKDIVHFQRELVSYVLGASEPLIQRSTGVYGLKWRQTVRNGFPIPYIPRRMYDAKTETWFPPVDLGNHKLSPEGEALFLGKGSERPG